MGTVKRITITLAPEIDEAIRREMGRSARGLEAVVHEALRRGLAMRSRKCARTPFKVKTFDFELRPGIDPDRLNAFGL